MTNALTEADPTSDSDLLRAIASERTNTAFSELVRRHGPVVLSVCRRVLADRPEADDAFQATFLVLAKKAGTIGRPEHLANWLYGVALRCARRAKAANVARWAKESPMTDVPAQPSTDVTWVDVRPVLDEEIGHLPDKLRAALVLCELQGLDRSAAATQLGVPIGTLSSRLARAKELLRHRLVKRGLAISLLGVAFMLTQATARAAVPPALAAATSAAAARFANGSASLDPTAILAHKELTLMFWKKLLVSGIAVAGLLLAVGTAAWLGGPAVARAFDDKKADKDLIQGNWKLISATLREKDLPEEQRKGIESFNFDGEKVTSPYLGSFKLDASKSPKEIDLTIDEPERRKGKFLGVYELDGDTLTLVLAEVGQDRPTKVMPGKNDVWAVLVLERVKK